jgi:hypothetical protein
MRNTPMMASPSEYRDTLWTVLHDGEITDEMKRKASANRPKGEIPKQAYSEMEEMMRQARILRGEDPDAPDERPVQVLPEV